jgi:hypothetical protein
MHPKTPKSSPSQKKQALLAILFGEMQPIKDVLQLCVFKFSENMICMFSYILHQEDVGGDFYLSVIA